MLFKLGLPKTNTPDLIKGRIAKDSPRIVLHHKYIRKYVHPKTGKWVYIYHEHIPDSKSSTWDPREAGSKEDILSMPTKMGSHVKETRETRGLSHPERGEKLIEGDAVKFFHPAVGKEVTGFYVGKDENSGKDVVHYLHGNSSAQYLVEPFKGEQKGKLSQEEFFSHHGIDAEKRAGTESYINEIDKQIYNLQQELDNKLESDIKTLDNKKEVREIEQKIKELNKLREKSQFEHAGIYHTPLTQKKERILKREVKAKLKQNVINEFFGDKDTPIDEKSNETGIKNFMDEMGKSIIEEAAKIAGGFLKRMGKRDFSLPKEEKDQDSEIIKYLLSKNLIKSLGSQLVRIKTGKGLRGEIKGGKLEQQELLARPQGLNKDNTLNKEELGKYLKDMSYRNAIQAAKSLAFTRKIDWETQSKLAIITKLKRDIWERDIDGTMFGGGKTIYAMLDDKMVQDTYKMNIKKYYQSIINKHKEKIDKIKKMNISINRKRKEVENSLKGIEKYKSKLDEFNRLPHEEIVKEFKALASMSRGEAVVDIDNIRGLSESVFAVGDTIDKYTKIEIKDLLSGVVEDEYIEEFIDAMNKKDSLISDEDPMSPEATRALASIPRDVQIKLYSIIKGGEEDDIY